MSAECASAWRLTRFLNSRARWAFKQLTHDRAAASDKATPSPRLVLLSSSCLALLIIFAAALYGYAGQLEWLFKKEGPLEQFTFAAELVAAAFMAIAARRVWLRSADAFRVLVTIAYAVLAVLLFVVGMEEIGWGQQLFDFPTPQGWAERNFQQETTLHNLLDPEGVNALGRYLTYAFLAGAIALTALGIANGNAFILAVAPHPSLIPLACAVLLARVKIHGEVVEAFVALYFLYYSYRVFRLSAGDQRRGQGAV